MVRGGPGAATKRQRGFRGADEADEVDKLSVSGFVRVALRPPESRLVP